MDVSFYAFWAVSGALLTDKFQIREGAYSPGGWAIHYQEPSLNKLVRNSKWGVGNGIGKGDPIFWSE